MKKWLIVIMVLALSAGDASAQEPNQTQIANNPGFHPRVGAVDNEFEGPGGIKVRIASSVTELAPDSPEARRLNRLAQAWIQSTAGTLADMTVFRYTWEIENRGG